MMLATTIVLFTITAILTGITLKRVNDQEKIVEEFDRKIARNEAMLEVLQIEVENAMDDRAGTADFVK